MVKKLPKKGDRRVRSVYAVGMEREGEIEWIMQRLLE